MLTVKKIGIWMDHSIANIMAFTRDPIETKTIESKFTHEVKESTLSKNENLMHNKEQHLQADYYKQLMAIIENYQEVILFGPTDAKTELYNLISADHKFEKIKIAIFQTDKMTENQQHAFVKQHFSEN
jgi:ADP-heptose:LPS heptosyltransferase